MQSLSAMNVLPAQMMPNARVPSDSSPGLNLTHIAKVSTQVCIHLSSEDSPYTPVWFPFQSCIFDFDSINFTSMSNSRFPRFYSIPR